MPYSILLRLPYRRVLTKSLACILKGPVCPAFALFLISCMSFFSWFSSLTRSRSSSRCVFSRARWCFLRRSAGVMRFPKAHSTIYTMLTITDCGQSIVGVIASGGRIHTFMVRDRLLYQMDGIPIPTAVKGLGLCLGACSLARVVVGPCLPAWRRSNVSK